MGPLPWHVVARAEVTKRLGHADRYLETRVFLADGRIMEQVNTGVPDIENDWKQVGRYADLRRSLREHRRDGWAIDAPFIPHWRWRAMLVLALLIVLVPITAYLTLSR